MSNFTPHAFISLLVLLLVSCTDVHSMHTEANPNSPNKKEVNQEQDHGLSKENSLSNTSNVLPDNQDVSVPTFVANDNNQFSSENIVKNSLHFTHEGFHSDDINVYNEDRKLDDLSINNNVNFTNLHEHLNFGETDAAFALEDDGATDSLTFNNTNSNNSDTNYSDPDLKDKHSSSQCLSCQRRNDSRNFRIQSIKHQILKHLNIKNLPNMSRKAIPKMPALSHLYNAKKEMMNDEPHSENEEHDGNDFPVKTERVFTAAREVPTGDDFNISDSVYFSQPVQLATSHVKTAKLWLYIRKAQLKKPNLLLTIKRIFKERGDTVFTKHVYSKRIDVDKAFGWKRIDLRDIVVDWVKKPLEDVGLQLRAEDEQGNNLVVLPPPAEVDRGYEPWLDIKVQELRANSRHRRSESLVCSDNTTETRCCRYPLCVNFIEFGWDWIIAPTHVKADYCSGECRMTMQDMTPYGWIHQQVPNSVGSCCSATKMASLALLYFDENGNIVYQILQNMKVDRCGCV